MFGIMQRVWSISVHSTSLEPMVCMQQPAEPPLRREQPCPPHVPHDASQQTWKFRPDVVAATESKLPVLTTP